MFPSVKAGIVDYLRGVYVVNKDRWVSGKALEDLVRFARYKKSNVGRRCRELANEGLIDRYLELRGKTKFVMYRYRKPKHESIVWKRKKLQDRRKICSRLKTLTH